ncbi:MAG: TetR/AcrR family transcriptional regulator [Clostridia bacterium]|nr:TetR/AcrR family transcriptional regulator [Clostridia bacterium]
MAEYSKARQRAITKIENAYWDLFIKEEKLTITNVIEKAKVHKSTFYFYFDNLDDVLNSIKENQINLLEQTLNNQNRKDKEFNKLTIDLRNLFNNNRKFLIPLVMEQRGGDFAIEYREIIKREFAKDIGLEQTTGNQVKDDISNAFLNGMIEILLSTFASEIIPLEDMYKIGFGIMEKGARKTLKEDLFIKIQ